MDATPPSNRRPPAALSGRALLTLWGGVFLAGTLLYGLTCQRTVSWQDSGIFQWRVLEGDLWGDLGLALSHPLYILIGEAITLPPIGPFAAKLNFLSGLGMAIALANLAGLLNELTGRWRVALAVAAMMAVAHTAWWLSSLAEVYTLSVAGLTAELWLLAVLIRRPGWKPLCGLALVNGLGLCVHNFALLPLPVYVVAAIALMARKRLSWKALPLAIACWLLGAGLYLGMTVELAMRTGDWAGAVRSALFGDLWADQVLNVGKTSTHFLANMAFTGLNFIGAIWLLAIVGLARIRRRVGGSLAACLIAVFLMHAVFFARYSVPDQFTFFLPTLTMLAVAAGVGLDVLTRKPGRWRKLAWAVVVWSVIAPPVAYAVLPSVAARFVPGGGRKPYRNEARYWVVPWKHNERSAQRFARVALDAARPDGVILCENIGGFPLMLVRDQDERYAGVAIMFDTRELPAYEDNPARFRKVAGDCPVIVAGPIPPRRREALQADANWQQIDEQGIWKLTWKTPSSQPAPAEITTQPADPAR